MKKFFLLIFLFFIVHSTAFAKTGISFVYINGSNIKDPKINRWYTNGIRKFHPSIKNAFEQDPFTKKYFLKNGEYFIEATPITFFWGDKNHNNSNSVKKNSAVPKGLILWLAREIRFTANNVLHDIIWIQNSHNMNFVANNLHEIVRAEARKCNKIVFYGYSSGSFVAYGYLLARTPYINVSEFFNSADATKEQRDFVSKHPMKNTCMSALEQKLAIFSDGHTILGNDFNLFKTNYMNLDNETDTACIPDNSVIGVIDIASPLVLFYSDISEPDFQLTYYNRLLYKYIFENGMFWLTVNYREDPLSFSSRRNLKIKEIENITNLDIEPRAGFIYDQSNTRGGVLGISHLSYLSQQKNLSKAVVRAYQNGFRYQYDDVIEQKPINKFKKKINVTP